MGFLQKTGKFILVLFRKKSNSHNVDDQQCPDLYYSLFENTTVGLYQTTPGGEIISANSALIKMLKFDSLEELKKLNISSGSYVDESKRDVFKKMMEENDEVIDFESAWYTKNGDILYVKEGARAVRNSSGEIVRYDGAVENITYLIKTQKELIKAKEKAEYNDRLKLSYLANISHEIRTPINGILGFADLLLEPDLEKEELHRYAELISKSGYRLLSTINDIIDISKIDSGQMSLVEEEFDVLELCKDLIDFFRIECLKKGLELKYENQIEQTSLVITSDRNKIESILSNLLKNAIKFTDSGYISVHGEIDNGRLKCSVSDTGMGIPKEKQEEIFLRFAQGSANKQQAAKGFGLGLSIVKAYIEMLGGDITLQSEINHGSTFSFTLPFQNS